jgi:hypothetical protein
MKERMKVGRKKERKKRKSDSRLKGRNERRIE